MHHVAEPLQMCEHLCDDKESLFKSSAERSSFRISECLFVPDTAGGSLCSRTETSRSRPGWTAAGSGRTPAGSPDHTGHSHVIIQYFTKHMRYSIYVL